MSDLEPSPEESGVEPVRKERERDDRTGRSAAAARIAQQATWVDLQVRQAMERGEFDDLPGKGKPIEDLGVEHDPDWWVKKLVERENIALLPPAIALRKEDAELHDRLDEITAESEVRRELADFNKRVVETRRQLQGGPPVITAPRDVDAEVTAWRERRTARVEAQRAAVAASRPAPRKRSWWSPWRER
ncbi:DUF1992 domain-containing protein [uncultured Nocardioides sp.]|uniref:DnaJ family domain-containing protein n=1 Tax=uncultured Nocardioides sp. TaxID=198441 RepID=UPI00263438C0|nr:DUF1992 domain-containing protein [uncultured Nocardioides sp.]